MKEETKEKDRIISVSLELFNVFMSPGWGSSFRILTVIIGTENRTDDIERSLLMFQSLPLIWFQIFFVPIFGGKNALFSSAWMCRCFDHYWKGYPNKEGLFECFRCENIKSWTDATPLFGKDEKMEKYSKHSDKHKGYTGVLYYRCRMCGASVHSEEVPKVTQVFDLVLSGETKVKAGKFDGGTTTFHECEGVAWVGICDLQGIGININDQPGQGEE